MGLRRVVAHRFPGPAALAADPSHAARLSTYLTDLLAMYSLRLTPGALSPVRGQSYGEMAAALLAEVLPAGEEVDLLVLAYDVPDIAPGRATTTWLTHVCPGTPMSFAVSDQGRAAPFTALRLILEHARTGTYGRSLLLAVEQSDLPYDPGVPVRLPAAHAGAALLFDASGGSTVRTLSDVDPDALGPVLAELDPSTVILGGPLAGQDVKADRVVLADPEQPSTGVWAALAELAEPHRVVVADYDPDLRYLCVAAFD